MRNEPPKKNTNRIARVNSLIEHNIGLIIRPYIENEKGIVTVKKVETSRDMRWAKVWISIVDGNTGTILDILRRNMYDIQGELNQHMETKIIPRLSFHLDTTGVYAQHIYDIFKKIEHEREQTPGENNDGQE
jgi:ribosome-binding factor A